MEDTIDSFKTYPRSILKVTILLPSPIKTNEPDRSPTKAVTFIDDKTGDIRTLATIVNV
jgi:hypothetical protein